MKDTKIRELAGNYQEGLDDYGRDGRTEKNLETIEAEGIEGRCITECGGCRFFITETDNK